MGFLTGAGLGAGFVLLGWAWAEPGRRFRTGPALPPWILNVTTEAGLYGVRGRDLTGLCLVGFFAGSTLMSAISGVLMIAVIVGLAASFAPIAVIRGRKSRRLREQAEAWPDAVDNLASAVRAGLSLPEALIQLGERGPEPLRRSFIQFGRDYQSTGRFESSLDLLKERLADPVGDRVIEALRIARQVGGGDLGRMLRSLSGFLRDDQRTRGELEARQSWTVGAARLAVGAPWAVLLAMSFQPDVIAQFASPTGSAVLLSGAGSCLLAYMLMARIGRLPVARRLAA